MEKYSVPNEIVSNYKNFARTVVFFLLKKIKWRSPTREIYKHSGYLKWSRSDKKRQNKVDITFGMLFRITWFGVKIQRFFMRAISVLRWLLYQSRRTWGPIMWNWRFMWLKSQFFGKYRAKFFLKWSLSLIILNQLCFVILLITKIEKNIYFPNSFIQGVQHWSVPFERIKKHRKQILFLWTHDLIFKKT